MIFKFDKVLKNASWIVACRVIQAFLALVINSFTARYFGPTGYGTISYAASLVAFITPIMRLGTADILTNEIIKNPEREGEIIGTSITMTIISSISCVLGLFTFVSIANKGDSLTITVVLLYSFLLLAQSIEQIQYWFHAKYLSKIVSITSLVAYVIISIYKIILLILQKDIYWFAASNAIDHCIIGITLVVIYNVNRGQTLKFSKAAAWQLWKNGRHFIIPELMGLVLEQSDRLMIRFMCGESETGLYSAAISVATLTSFIFSAIIVSFRSVILEHKILDQNKYKYYITKLYGIVLYLSLAQCIFIATFGGLMVRLLFGAEYLSSIPMLKIAIWYTLFSYIGAVRTVWILAEEQQKYLWVISSSGMIINVILNYILIRRFGGQGAAVATLVTQIFTNIVVVSLIKPLRQNIKYMFTSLDLRKWLRSYDELHVEKN